MIWLVFGGLALFALLGGMRAFERASVKSIKSFVAWVFALGGLSLALMLILTGRGDMAIAAFILFGPAIWERWRASHRGPGPAAGNAGRAGAGAGRRPPPGQAGAMSREEAYEVLGLRPGASEAEIHAAYRRTMRGAHPDAGGSDWLAARVNLARDVLLGPVRRHT